MNKKAKNNKGENMKLDGKVAIVTGGAMGNGLGIVKVLRLSWMKIKKLINLLLNTI